MGHYATQCPHKIEKEKKMKHHAHVVDVEEHKPKYEEFIFISSLTRTMTQGRDTWLIDCGAKHMTKFINSLSKLIENNSSLQVVLGDDSKHAIKVVGEASLQLDSSNPFSIKIYYLYKS
jgi:hypothetical protein